MCGIAGFTGEDPEKIRRMTEALLHRGPDGNATTVKNGVSLGHARLAILDPRPEGNQPMWNEDRTIAIVYNGEVFNFRELRKKYGLQTKTETDTEVLLLLYEKFGMKFVPELLGMFAFAIHDARDRSLHLARDPSGIKPLYIAKENGVLYFASESRAILRVMQQKPAINLEALSLYMRLQYVPGPQTLCEGVESVPAGTVLSWKDGRESRCIVLPSVPVVRESSKKEYGRKLIDLIDDVVKDHLISDKPLGIFLSGGMDSTILLHHMAKHSPQPVRTFTVRFDVTDEEGAKRFNTDADLAQQTAKHYGTDHHEILLTAEIARDIYKQTAIAEDQPNANAVARALYLMAKEAKKYVDVALMGSGGDELFGGYPRYRIAKVLHTTRFIPARLRKMAGRLTGHPQDVLGLRPGPELAERLLTRPKKEVMSLVRGDWYRGNATPEYFAAKFAQTNTGDPVRDFMEVDRNMWLIDESLRLSDGVTMASGLECRVPFLDPRIIASSHGTPSGWHVTRKETKALLKEIYRPLLPPHIYSLSKAGFFPPLAKWIRRECGVLVTQTFDHPRLSEYVDTNVVRKLYEEHCTHTGYHFHALSTVMQLCAWFDAVYDAD